MFSKMDARQKRAVVILIVVIISFVLLACGDFDPCNTSITTAVEGHGHNLHDALGASDCK